MGSPAQDSAPLTRERAQSSSNLASGELETLAAAAAAAVAVGRVFGEQLESETSSSVRRSFRLPPPCSCQ